MSAFSDRVCLRLFQPWALFRVHRVEARDCFEVRVEPKAFDYTGAVELPERCDEQTIEAQLTGLRDQMVDDLLNGRAPLRKAAE